MFLGGTKQYFNPPTPWGVGPGVSLVTSQFSDFNPPTPWGVGQIKWITRDGEKRFQSTHPVGGGTGSAPPRVIRLRYFNPPTPWGVGPALYIAIAGGLPFQSTHPVGGGTAAAESTREYRTISIHPPRGGWDLHPSPARISSAHFNPPTPWGVGLPFMYILHFL